MSNKAGRLWKFRIDHMIEACEEIIEFTKGIEAEEFYGDKKSYRSVERCFQILGEAAKHIPTEKRESMEGIPWREINGMRNIVVHEYDNIVDDVSQMTCAEVSLTSEDKFDPETFMMEQVEVFGNNHAGYDLTNLKKSILSDISRSQKIGPNELSDYAPTSSWMYFWACHDKEMSQENLGVRIQKLLYCVYSNQDDRAAAGNCMKGI